MRSVVITGSTRGIGYALAARFLAAGYCVTVSGTSSKTLARAGAGLAGREDSTHFVRCDVTQWDDVVNLWQAAKDRWGTVDIWINNAGIVQTETALWNLSAQESAAVVSTNMLGTVFGSQVAAAGMLAQGRGMICNMEGFGSEGEMRFGLGLYGTTKCGLTYFSRALAKELRKTAVRVCRINPGMVVTDLVKHPVVHGAVGAPRPQVVKIFNILGDTPETAAEFLVKKLIRQPKNGASIRWLTPQKIAWRFLRSNFVQRDLFS